MIALLRRLLGRPPVSRPRATALRQRGPRAAPFVPAPAARNGTPALRSSGAAAAQAGARSPANRVAPGVAFTPTQPKSGRRRLVGRDDELRRILQAMREDRAHVVLYSERGRGKTSLSNLVVESLRRSGTIVARHTCEAGTTFDSLLRGLMHDLPTSLLTARINLDADVAGCEAALPAAELRPRDILELPQRLACRNLVCLVDEFDRVQDARTRTWLADTIKQLSDRDVPMLFLIVGVSENLDQILGQHPSIQRSVLGVHLPLFTDQDVAQLIARGGREAGLTFLPTAVARITVVARGMPYIAQLLGLRLAQAATARGDTQVNEDDFDVAVGRMLDDAPARVVALYASLTTHGRDAPMVTALRRIVTAPQDPWGQMLVLRDGPVGTITTNEAPAENVQVGGRIVAGAIWNRLVASNIVQPVLPGSDLFVFTERGLMHHVLLLAARDSMLSEPAGTTPTLRDGAPAKLPPLVALQRDRQSLLSPG